MAYHLFNLIGYHHFYRIVFQALSLMVPIIMDLIKIHNISCISPYKRVLRHAKNRNYLENLYKYPYLCTKQVTKWSIRNKT